MKVKCEYCGAYIDNTKETCPQCGAANKSMNRSANGAPRTIEELKRFCEDNHMPLDKMRFFIGEDYRGPKAFGIYKDGDNVIVYKNKADGTRAARYEGNDEEYGVNEIYQKLKEEIAKQMAGGNVTPVRDTRASTMASTAANVAERKRREKWDLRLDYILFFSGVVIVSSIAVILLVWLLDSVGINSQSDSQRRSTYENSAPVQNDYVPTSNHRPSRSDYGYDSYMYLYDDYLYNNYNYGYDYDYEYDYDYDYDTYDSYDSYSDYGYDSYNYDSYDYSDSWNSYDYSDSWNSDSWDSYDYDYGGWDSDYTDWGSDW